MSATIVAQAPSLDEIKLPVNGVGSAESGGSVEDDQSNLSTSSTKQRSLETKSTGSVTTFAMDEKESIRPDDSASVRAIDEEDVGSTLSRHSTFYQEPEVVMPTMRGEVRVSGPGLANAARRYPTLTNPPQFGDLESSPIPLEHSLAQAAPDAPAASTGEPEEHFGSAPITPDEKIFDGLASQKDRIFILQVEEKILAFITQEAASYMDFPPQNGYARLLIHRTAEYYGLHHWINEDGTTVRLFRNNLPFTRPTALAILARTIPVAVAQPLGPAAVKIMRRAGVGVTASSFPDSTATSSSAPSKATSDAGISEDGLMSPIEGTPNRDKSKMTREEREAQYKAARERIFGDFQEMSVNEGALNGDNSADISRSSSSSGRKKSKKQRQPKDDSFEARSAFIPSYGLAQPSSTGYHSPQYFDQPYENQHEMQAAQFGSAGVYGTTPTQAYPGFDQGMHYNSTMQYEPTGPQPFGQAQDWSAVQSSMQGGQYSLPQSPNGYQHGMQPMMQQVSPQYTQPQQTNYMQQPAGWPNTQFQNPYQTQMTSPNAGMQWPAQPPQQYSPMPGPFFGNTVPASQLSMVDNQNRSLFNPQTRSFVPNAAVQRGNGRNNRKKNQPGVQRQNSSMSRSSASENLSSTTATPTRNLSIPGTAPPKPREESLQQKYGKPANLPNKPPPSKVTSQFDAGSISAVRNPSAAVATGGGNEAKASLGS